MSPLVRLAIVFAIAAALALVAVYFKAEHPHTIVGTLYLGLQPDSAGSPSGLSTLEQMQDGKVVRRYNGYPPITARRNGNATMWYSAPAKSDPYYARSNGGYKLDAMSCGALVLSSDGQFGACDELTSAYFLKIVTFANGNATQKLTSIRLPANPPHQYAFVGTKLIAVTEFDRSCPFFRPADKHFVDISPSRLMIVDLNGRIVKRGACVYGVVAGDHRVAYTNYDSRGEFTYSTDLIIWKSGLAETFDGEDRLLVITKQLDLVDEDGNMIARGIESATWSME